MEHLRLTPQLVADILVVAFFLSGALRRHRRWPPPQQASRGTALVFRGCYAITLIALNFTAPATVTAALPLGWIGVLAAASGLARVLATLAEAPPVRTPGRRIRRHPDSFGNLVFWIGAAAASLNVIAMLTVAVAMLAATGVRVSVETAPSGGPSPGALSGSGDS